MKLKGMPFLTLWAVLSILPACTTSRPAPPTVTQATSEMSSSHRMFYWLEEARELHAMATHTDREAELMLKTKPGLDTDEFVKQMRELAHQLHQVARYADAQAKEAERENPSDMTQQFHSTLR